ncbi:MAG TPA: AMP-binding protein, partial [Pseudonocardiaceae bacterium]
MNTTNTVHARSALHAAVRPDHPAIRCEDRQFTYRQLHVESNRTAHALLAAGLRAGARVAYLGRESEHYYGIVLACAKTGMVMVPINWRLTAAEIDHILRDSGAELLFVERDFLPAAQRVLPAVPGLRTLVQLDRPGEPFGGFLEWRGDVPEHDLDPRTDTDYPVVQLYTSGTTGLPKGVVLAHRTFFTLIDAIAEHGADWLDWRPSDVSLIAFPGFYTAGMGWFMHGFNAGATNLIMRLFVSEEAVRLIEQDGVTITFVAPAMLHMMLRERGVTSSTFRSLRKVAYGAAPIAEDLLRACLDTMRCEFAQIYASTETGSVAACLPPADHV